VTQQQPPPNWQPQGAQGPPVGYAPTAPPKKRKVWPWVLLGVCLVLILGFAGCVAIIGTAANQVGDQIKADSRPVLVTYEVTGEGVSTANNITYTKDVNLGQEQATGQPLPWKKDIQFGEGLFKPLSIVAQAGDGTGTITCRILVDGAEVTKSTSQGQFAVVSCSGDVPKATK
jgi:Mycobacterium membrane protein